MAKSVTEVLRRGGGGGAPTPKKGLGNKRMVPYKLFLLNSKTLPAWEQSALFFARHKKIHSFDLFGKGYVVFTSVLSRLAFDKVRFYQTIFLKFHCAF